VENNRIILSTDTNEIITLGPLDFVVFIDETGHEFFKDPNYPIFGLGGCGILVQNYTNLIEAPWIDIKQTHFKNEKIKLHASDSHSYSSEQIQAIGEFFKNNDFCRIATILTDKTSIPDEIEMYQVVANNLMLRIADIAKKWNRTKIIIIFEESQRGDDFNRIYFDEFNKMKVTRDGKEFYIPVEKYKAPKSTMNGLEVADFIMHAAGGQVRAYRENTSAKVRKDYQCVFKDIEPGLISYLEITNIEIS